MELYDKKDMGSGNWKLMWRDSLKDSITKAVVLVDVHEETVNYQDLSNASANIENQIKELRSAQIELIKQLDFIDGR